MLKKHPGSPKEYSQGFALISVLLLISLLVVLLATIATSFSLSQRSVSAERDANYARQSALVGLKIALGELQAAAGPDQRITATASILGNPDNAYTSEVTPIEGQSAWTGVWKSSTVATEEDEAFYKPTEPDNKEFVGWLVSGTDDNGEFALPDTLNDASKDVTEGDYITMSAKSDGTAHINVEKVLIDDVETHGQHGSGARNIRGKRYFAFSVEDEGVKADLSWNETTSPTVSPERAQQMRLSSVPGPGYQALQGPNKNGPFGKLNYPLTTEDPDSFLEDSIALMSDPADLEALMSDVETVPEWLSDMRGDITWGSRGVLCDVKKGGLRRDLSLAFEMDDDAESENATLFNEQTEEFVGNGDVLSSPYPMPGTTLAARHLFRDYGPADLNSSNDDGAGDFFSRDITQPETVVRGPSWWLMRDYANLYKRLTTSSGKHSLNARAYFPNRTTPLNNGAGFAEDLNDIHADNQWQTWRYGKIKVSPTNRETNPAKNSYAYRPVRANYAPVLLGVNAIYSLVYKSGQLEMTVDPFFIIWNPYNTEITAEKFAVTLENGFPGGMRFRHTPPNGTPRLYGRPSSWGGGRGSDTTFFDFAKHKTGVNAQLSYLISDLQMDAGEVIIYSPPNENDRSDDANEINDELLPGMNYDASTSGIFFDEFPEYNASRQFLGWKSVNIPTTENAQHTIEVLFNVASQSGPAIVNIIETNLPAPGSIPSDLTTEPSFGMHLAGQESRLNLGGGQHSTNIDTGQRGFSLSYTFDELGSTKKSFGLLSMLTIPTDYAEADTAMEVFSQINATPIVRTQLERFNRAPFNIVVKSVPADGINNLMNEAGIDIDAIGSGQNGFYGKNYDFIDGDTSFPLLDIPKAPLHSLVQFSGANIGTRLFEPTHALGNSWKPPYIPTNSIYYSSASYVLGWYKLTMNDVSWQINDAIFDRFFLSGLAPEYTITSGGYNLSSDASLNQTLTNFYSSDYKSAMANPALLPYLPPGKSAIDIVNELTPDDDQSDGYKKLSAYSLINGAFNINSTSVAAWSALLSGNKDMVIEPTQGSSDSAPGTPFPLNSSPADTLSNNGWEKFSRLSDDQITTLASAIVDQIKKRGPFMSISDFVNRRIAEREDPYVPDNPNDPDDPLAYRGAIQAAIENSGINDEIRANSSDTTPNYSNYNVFPYADDPDFIGDRNNATGIPLEINQANLLLPIAPRLTARTDTFRIRSYGEVRSSDDTYVRSKAVCEAIVQRFPEYIDNETDQPWIEGDLLSETNQIFGRRFKIVQLRWLAPDEI